MAADAEGTDPGRGHSPAAVRRRQGRVEEKRLTVLRATLDLIEEGVLDPTIQQIEERSGVPERSIFRYFDKEELALGALALAAEEFHATRGVPQTRGGPLDRRIVHLVEHRIRSLSSMANLGRASRIRAVDSPELDRQIVGNAHQLRDDYGLFFEPELARLDDDERHELLDVITALLTFEGYDVLRRRLGRTDDEIASTWGTALHQLLS